MALNLPIPLHRLHRSQVPRLPPPPPPPPTSPPFGSPPPPPPPPTPLPAPELYPGSLAPRVGVGCVFGLIGRAMTWYVLFPSSVICECWILAQTISNMSSILVKLAVTSVIILHVTGTFPRRE